MQVFISWSGGRSKKVAGSLSDWISQVIQAVDPWLSSDIDKGARWSPEISSRLEKSKVGIVCLTRENLDNRWILFEAGALSKTKDAYVCTLLLDVLPTDVEQPLGQFQHTARDKKDIHQLVRTINKAVESCGEKNLPDTRLDEVFDLYWPQLSDSLENIAKSPPEDGGTAPRTERELLEELLELTRANERRIAALNRKVGNEQSFAEMLKRSYRGGPSKDSLIELFSAGRHMDRDTEVSTLRELLELVKRTTREEDPPSGNDATGEGA